MSVLDVTTNHKQIVADLTDFAEGLVDENAILQVRLNDFACLLESTISHNDSLISRIEFWRGKAVYAFTGGVLLGSGLIALAAFDVWQLLNRALNAVGWLA